MKHHPKQSAFTLVELAIVLVIIGLIVGGVLVGRDLIDQAELRAIVNEKERHVAAFYTFRTKYGAIPGDMQNAHQYFGDDCGINTSAINTGCNGNGNGMIISGETGENTKAWEHLSRAGLIGGIFDGTGTVAPSGALIPDERNMPESRFPKGYWNIGLGAQEECCEGLANTLVLGSPVNDTFLGPLSSMTHEQALRLDIKLDNGLSETGSVRGLAGNCLDGTPSGSDPYALQSSGAQTKGDCTPTFIF